MNKNEYKLAEGIIALSVAKTWDQAKLEWELQDIYNEDDPDTCLCGHYPIVEICLLLNRYNQKSAIVGNCCVKKFMGINSGKLFDAIKRVKNDDTKSLNPETIDHAYKNGWVTDWDRSFYINIWRKRSLTAKQQTKKSAINQKVLKGLSTTKRVK